MEERGLYTTLRQEKPMNDIPRRTGPSRVDQANATRVLRVTISAENRKNLKIYQLKQGLTADGATDKALKIFFEEHPQ